MKIFNRYFLLQEIIEHSLIEYFKDLDTNWILSVEKIDDSVLEVYPENDMRTFKKEIEYNDKLKNIIKETIDSKIECSNDDNEIEILRSFLDDLKGED
jgi:hypothetical protein